MTAAMTFAAVAVTLSWAGWPLYAAVALAGLAAGGVQNIVECFES